MPACSLSLFCSVKVGGADCATGGGISGGVQAFTSLWGLLPISPRSILVLDYLFQQERKAIIPLITFSNILSNSKSLSSIQRHCPVDWIRRPHQNLLWRFDSSWFWWRFNYWFVSQAIMLMFIRSVVFCFCYDGFCFLLLS